LVELVFIYTGNYIAFFVLPVASDKARFRGHTGSTNMSKAVIFVSISRQVDVVVNLNQLLCTFNKVLQVVTTSFVRLSEFLYR